MELEGLRDAYEARILAVSAPSKGRGLAVQILNANNQRNNFSNGQPIFDQSIDRKLASAVRVQSANKRRALPTSTRYLSVSESFGFCWISLIEFGHVPLASAWG
jgi:type 1 fimbria pilin